MSAAGGRRRPAAGAFAALAAGGASAADADVAIGGGETGSSRNQLRVFSNAPPSHGPLSPPSLTLYLLADLKSPPASKKKGARAAAQLEREATRNAKTAAKKAAKDARDAAKAAHKKQRAAASLESREKRRGKKIWTKAAQVGAFPSPLARRAPSYARALTPPHPPPPRHPQQ